MNKSEIAEKATDEILSFVERCDSGYVLVACKKCQFAVKALVERAIAESQAPTGTISQGGCSGTMPVYGAELGDGEPSPPPAKQPRTFICVRNRRESELATHLKELVIIKQVNAYCFKVWFGGVFCGVEGSEVAAKNKGNVMINSVLRKLRVESGAAQEVSPPSPAQPQSLIALQKWERDTGKPASCSEGNAFIDGFNAGFEDKWDAEYRRGKSEAEGDTRELKAALKEMTWLCQSLSMEMVKAEDYNRIFERANRLLGSG